MQPIVAETSLIYQDPNGVQHPLRLYVRAPYEGDDGVWACPCCAEGLLDSEKEIFGDDSFLALALAFRFLQVFLSGLEAHGARFSHVGDGEFAPFPVSLCFGVPTE